MCKVGLSRSLCSVRADCRYLSPEQRCTQMATPPPAPIFRPSYEEWKDFAAYVRMITPQIERYGACQVIPPPEWEHKPVQPRTTSRGSEQAKTEITPIRQHVAGTEGKYQAVMEQCDETDLGKFVADSVTASAKIEDAVADGCTPEDLDAKFWRSAAARPSPLYGADTSEAGSLFDPAMKVWNLGALPGGADNDLTQSLPMAIPGLNRSMLYFGQWKSFFALHTEDCELQGASYLHYGAVRALSSSSALPDLSLDSRSISPKPDDAPPP